MKKMFRKVLATALAAVMALGTVVAVNPSSVKADDAEYDMFLAYGGGAEWEYFCYGADGNVGKVTATTAKAKVGDTVTIGISSTEAISTSYFFAPCIIVDDAANNAVDFTLDKVTINGEDVTSTIDLSIREDGAKYWVEDTGNYKGNCIRLGGGYNEWADKYVTLPESITEIMYTITINSVGPATSGYDMFLSYGGGAEWEYFCYGADGNVGKVTATTAVANVGDTVTIGISSTEAISTSYFFAPCIIIDDAANTSIDFTLDKVTINGEDVTSTIDLSIREDGAKYWVEDTGNYKGNCIRLGGGYNEWADKYVTLPESITEIMYTITLTAVGDAVATPDDEPAGATFDPSAKYNAYIGFQTPSYSFRNEWYEASYGLGTDYFNQATGWESDVAVQKQGTISDVVIDGNGTYRVSITDLGSWMADEINASDNGIFNCLFISTDIPVDADVEITNVKLIIDGSTKHTDKVAFLNPDAKDYINILIQNIWNDEKAEISYYAAPTSSLEMEFTISGFDYDNASQSNDDADTNADANTDGNAEKGGIDPIVVVVIVVVVVAVVAAVVVVSKKNKKNN